MDSALKHFKLLANMHGGRRPDGSKCGPPRNTDITMPRSQGTRLRFLSRALAPLDTGSCGFGQQPVHTQLQISPRHRNHNPSGKLISSDAKKRKRAPCFHASFQATFFFFSPPQLLPICGAPNPINCGMAPHPPQLKARTAGNTEAG